jgi:RHS repeat-associated protein
LTSRTRGGLTQNFTVNNLNQVTGGSRSGTLTVEGTTEGTATAVTVNGNSATVSGSTFARSGQTLVDGTNTFTAIGQDALGRSGSHTINAYLPASPTFTYDSNGNMVFDGLKAFEYDDENQLWRVTQTNAWKSEFTYDGKMRRRVRKEYTWRGGVWVLTNDVRYVYDGNLVLQERNENNIAQVSYTRGKDLSGSLEGAGGIGGLLARSDNAVLNIQPTAAHAYYYADGNGNIVMLINSDQTVVATYLYEPFGNTLSAGGPLAHVNLYRFSSKEWHGNSSLTYYLYRYYAPKLQRWINIDPIQEDGGFNLYAFVHNDAARHDAFGLACIKGYKQERVYWQGTSVYTYGAQQTDTRITWTKTELRDDKLWCARCEYTWHCDEITIESEEEVEMEDCVKMRGIVVYDMYSQTTMDPPKRRVHRFVPPRVLSRSCRILGPETCGDWYRCDRCRTG